MKYSRSKVQTYYHYFREYLKHGDLRSIIDSVVYILTRRGAFSNRTIRTRYGKMFCRKGTNDFQFANYAYEWGVKSYLLEVCTDYDVFLDIGAGIGDYSILMAQKGLEVYSFEPVHDNFHSLQRNVRINNLNENIRLFPFGLGDDNYETNFYIAPVNKGSCHKAGLTKLILKKEKGSFERVSIRKFDDLKDISAWPRETRILAKVDIEGMEPEALEGMKSFIARYPHMSMVMEDVHSGQNNIRSKLTETAAFEIRKLDTYNLVAFKQLN